MKKIIALLITAIYIIVGFGVTAAAVDSKVHFDITSLKIMTGDESGDLKLDEAVTRAEFAAVVTRLLRYDELAASLSVATDFKDVQADDWFAKYVALVYTVGIMNGVSSDSFAPMETVTFEQAVKSIVMVLGYGIMAEQNGGYPNGHIFAAASIGLIRNISRESGFTRGSLMQLLYNALDIDMLVNDRREDNYKIERGQTLRSIYLRSDADSVVIKERGIITSNADTWLNAPNPSLKDNEVEIDDIKYRVGDSDAKDYIGQMVEFYAFEDANETKTLLSVKPASTNTVTYVEFRDIIKASASSIIYEFEQRNTTLSINGAKIIKNGRRLLTYTDDDLQISKGNIIMIDNDGDQTADVVFVDDFINVQVKDIKNNSIEFTPKGLFKNSRFMHIDLDNKEFRYNITDNEGKQIKVEDIPADSILSISESADEDLYKITVSTKNIEGYVSEISDTNIIIDGIDYPFYDGEMLDFAPGDLITAYLDYKGYIADFKEYEKSNKYAYLLVVQSGETLFKNIHVKMLVGSPVEFEFDKNVEDLDDTNPIPVINCKNKGTEVFAVANILTKDGIQYKTNTSIRNMLTPGLYEYELNSESELIKLTSAQFQGGGTNMVYNAFDKTFAGNTFRDSFAIDEDSAVINLPTNNVTSDEDYLVPLKISNKESDVTFFVEGYDFNANTKKVKVLVFHNAMRANDVLNIEEINIGMVERIVQALDEENEAITRFTILTKAGKIEHVARYVEGKNDVLKTLKTGDLIYYEIDLMDNLCNARVIQSFSHGVSNWSDIDEAYGRITDISYDEIHTTGNLVTRLKMDTQKGEFLLNIQQRNTPPIFIFNPARQSISTATIADVLPGSHDETIYILKDMDNMAKACVIFKKGGGSI